MILLATMDYKLIGGGDANTLLYFLIAIGVVIGLIVVGSLVNRRRRPLTAQEVQKYSSAAFRRAGRSVGLPPQHVQALEELVRITKVKQPFLVFSSAGLLDDVLKKGLYSVEVAREMSPEDKEQRKAILFQVKQLIEQKRPQGRGDALVGHVEAGSAPVRLPRRGHFPSKVVSNMKDFLTISAPAGPAGAEMRWMRGTPLAVYFWRENDAGYTFPSKVLGYDTVKGLSCVLIQHSKTLRREQRGRRGDARSCGPASTTPFASSSPARDARWSARPPSSRTCAASALSSTCRPAGARSRPSRPSKRASSSCSSSTSTGRRRSGPSAR